MPSSASIETALPSTLRRADVQHRARGRVDVGDGVGRVEQHEPVGGRRQARPRCGRARRSARSRHAASSRACARRPCARVMRPESARPPISRPNRAAECDAPPSARSMRCSSSGTPMAWYEAPTSSPVSPPRQHKRRAVREDDGALGVECHEPLVGRTEQRRQGFVGTGDRPANRHGFLRDGRHGHNMSRFATNRAVPCLTRGRPSLRHHTPDPEPADHPGDHPEQVRPAPRSPEAAPRIRHEQEQKGGQREEREHHS